ncbi:two-component system response regulator [Campylobacter iguaniorum]|uniref:response regulator transcription factor n=1 Tax=Campylobacter iguaniorum TaxID=1244531 RepID=UPI00073A0C9C|nr:response regulator transcription factor [Campylobacter iguaniorum]ALV24156.1 two-component system response regulator [Campylobacter iguaniorum]
MSKILLIEDDLEMQELLKDYLRIYEFSVSSFSDPLAAIKELEECEFILVILDLMLPKLDGFEVCKRIRKFSQVPIIISSARGNLGDKVLAYECGADDYLAKPYEPKELIMRINAILKRAMPKATAKQIGEFSINEDACKIFYQGFQLDLTKIEYEILTLLLNNKGKILSRSTINQALQKELKDRSIDMHISNIRNKLLDDSKSPKFIKSVWGMGYEFIG